MDDQLYKILKVAAITLVAIFIGYSIYDGLIAGKDEYTLTLGAAHRYFEDRDYRAALREFDAALKLKPGRPEAIYGKAIAYMQLGDNEEALEAFEQAIATDMPDTDKAFFYANRGILHDRLGHYEEALADYKMALTLNPETAEGPGMITRLLRNQPDKPPTIADRALYLQTELAKPEEERLLRVPEIDEQQRSVKK